MGHWPLKGMKSTAGTSLAVRVPFNTGDQNVPSLGSPTEPECGQCLVQCLAQCSAILALQWENPFPRHPSRSGVHLKTSYTVRANQLKHQPLHFSVVVRGLRRRAELLASLLCGGEEPRSQHYPGEPQYCYAPPPSPSWGCSWLCSHSNPTRAKTCQQVSRAKSRVGTCAHN